MAVFALGGIEMKRANWLTAVAVAALAAGAVLAADNELSSKEKDEGWRLLFDGKTLNGWKSTGNAESWVVEDGAISTKAMRGGYLYTTDQFENFRLAVDYKVTPGTNSGVFFRWSDLKDPVNTGVEMQVFDSAGKQPGKHEDGAIYDIIPPGKIMSKPAGEWNNAVITCDGPLISINLNGEKVAEMDVDRWTEAGKNPDGTPNKFKYAYKELPRKGYIGFQDHGGVVWYRNIKIQPLP
jgi:hypothetical protein